jgi:hypothetical protein
MFSFILGALTGGLAAWWWRGDIQKYVEEKLPNVRGKAADRLTAIEQKAEEALGKAREQIDRIRTGSDSGTRDKREMPSSPRSTGNYTQGTGV